MFSNNYTCYVIKFSIKLWTFKTVIAIFLFLCFFQNIALFINKRISVFKNILTMKHVKFHGKVKFVLKSVLNSFYENYWTHTYKFSSVPIWNDGVCKIFFYFPLYFSLFDSFYVEKTPSIHISVSMLVSINTHVEMFNL